MWELYWRRHVSPLHNACHLESSRLSTRSKLGFIGYTFIKYCFPSWEDSTGSLGQAAAALGVFTTTCKERGKVNVLRSPYIITGRGSRSPWCSSIPPSELECGCSVESPRKQRIWAYILFSNISSPRMRQVPLTSVIEYDYWKVEFRGNCSPLSACYARI